MGGGEQHGRGAVGAQRVDPDAVGVDRDGRGRGEPVAEVLAGAERARVLDGDLGDAGPAEHLAEQGEGLGGSGDDQDLVGVGADAPVTGEPV